MALGLPLDIRLSDLTEWLLVRRYVKPNWIRAVKEVRKKISIALKDMPECEEIKKLLSHTQITYYQSEEIVAILMQTEQDSKNFLGMYSSQRMKDWQGVIQLYRSDNIYLADAALTLSNLVKFELPSIRKDLLILEKRIAEQMRKAEQDRKSAEQQEKLYREEVSRRGLKGNYLPFELMMSTGPLTKIFHQLNDLIMALLPAVDYYKKSRLPGRWTVLPLLQFYLEKGNVTAFEWLYGYAPEETEKFSLKNILFPNKKKPVEDPKKVAGQMNSLSLEEDNDFGTEDKTDGIQLMEEGHQTKKNKKRPTVQEGLNLLENGKTRRDLMYDIHQLRLFLVAVEENESRQHPSDLLPSLYVEYDVPLFDVWKWTATASQILDIVNNPTTSELFEIRHNPRYLDDLVAHIQSRQTKADFFKGNAMAAEKLVEDMKQEYQLVANTYQEVKMESEKLEQRLCKDLACLTKGRPVHLLGGVKSLL